MAISHALHSTRDTIRLRKHIEMDAKDFNSSDPASTLSCEQRELMPAVILDGASSAPDGSAAEQPKAAS